MGTKFMTLDAKQKEPKKETVFTHCLNRLKEVSECYSSPKDWDNVLHIGYEEDYGDVFKCWDDGEENNFGIYFGVKGDEFNN